MEKKNITNNLEENFSNKFSIVITALQHLFFLFTFNLLEKLILRGNVKQSKQIN